MPLKPSLLAWSIDRLLGVCFKYASPPSHCSSSYFILAPPNASLPVMVLAFTVRLIVGKRYIPKLYNLPRYMKWDFHIDVGMLYGEWLELSASQPKLVMPIYERPGDPGTQAGNRYCPSF